MHMITPRVGAMFCNSFQRSSLLLKPFGAQCFGFSSSAFTLPRDPDITPVDVQKDRKSPDKL